MEIIPYASRTGTQRNLSSLKRHGWRLLVSATGRLRTEGFDRYALDNGAWTAFQNGKPIDLDKFTKALRMLGKNADWCVMPDIVAGGEQSLELSLKWMRSVLDECQMGMLSVQDGMTVDMVRELVGPRVGIFVGGSTGWKLDTMNAWCELARERSAWCHVARVNSPLRIRKCQRAGAHSFDGTNASRFAQNHPKLNCAIRQQTLDLDFT